MIERRGLKREIGAKVIALVSILILAGVSSASDEGDTLLARARQIFGVLPKVIGSESNPVTAEKVRLGKMLFYETRISVDGTVSCARCHPMGLYGADGLKKSIGNTCRVNPRNAPTVLNAAGQISAHWIGNRTGVEDQAEQAVTGPPSFGMPSAGAAAERLKKINGYVALFREAFPEDGDPVTVANFARAVGAFERTLVTPSPFDAFLKGDPTTLPEGGKRGLGTFIETGCGMCHSGVWVGGEGYEKFGVFESYRAHTGSPEVDEGRFAVTKNESDRYVFKIPGLRNVRMTAPYFHDGSVDHLRDAVRIMGRIQLGKTLTDLQIGEILLFLESLTGEIPGDALAVPLLPPDE
jgi:cytochrome c peroxidase